MTLPSKKQQIDTVAMFLDSDRNEGRSLEEIATDIVNGYHELLMAGVKKPATPMREGMLIKSPLDGKVRRVAWMSDDRIWVVAETSSYGWLSSIFPAIWGYCEEFRPKRRVDGKMVEMSDEMIEEAWSNPDWRVGDKASQRQRQFLFEVIATGPQCVLLRDSKSGVLNADSNSNLERYYQRESKVTSEW